ncbi:hypothetical protein KUTeg_023876 [Tegillarca granosa]|uniref:Major facilitator superfamily (MFS) profile domain-containing protein n=1 Tax=Tegillarca granosa TaxID=220873 RepID=A0ABQ9E7R7_TEGGR|nr:hypothetical protein KUTeg_023876 [Tegillarca granosa]
MEIAPEHMAGTSHALAGLFSNVGMMLAGFPLTYVAKIYDWQTTFLLLGTVVLVTVIYLVFKIKKELSNFPAEKYRKVIFLS